MPIETRPYAAIAQEYARDVIKGRIPACKSIRLQCERFLEELKLQRKRDFPFRFDVDKAERVCRFIERLPHTKGKWARSKDAIRLEPWQVWVICLTFGWVHKASGLRRFRVLFVVVPRKNGKSAISAGIGLYMLCADGECGAEVYSGATNEKQAWEVFRPARLTALRTPALCNRFGIEVNAASLVRVEDFSKFETITGDPGDGQSPSCSIHDEYHEHADDGQVDTMQTGMGARDQPLQILITTAGDNLAGPCYARIQEERKKVEGVGYDLHDETLFIEYTIDEGDDWKAESSLRKANPNFNVSVSGDFLRARQRDAIATPRKAGVFKTKHLNLWVSAKAAWFDIEAWRRCRRDWIPVKAVDGLALERLRGRRCILGLDLATKNDIAALEYLFPPIGEAATHDDPFVRLGRYFLPGARVEDVPAYQGWDAQALLDVTEGNVTDFSEIERAIEEAGSLFDIEAVAFDPWQATQLAQRMMAVGVPMLEYRMTVQNLSAPMKELDALTKSGGIAHGGCPVMEWEMSNVVGKLDLKDNVFPNKPVGQNHLKIDNPMALMMALGVAISGKETGMATSPWDDPAFSVAGAA